MAFKRSVLWAAVATTAVASGLMGTPYVQASGLDRAMTDTFNSMVNTTPPSYAQSGQRGVITGGQMVIKNQITNAQLFNLQMPYIHAGCGGWDLFGGSFSMISSAQIVAMMRSIASNALSYAFSLALEAISPSMSQKLDEIENAMNMLNNSSINSCRTGMAIVNSMTGHPGVNLADIKAQFFQSDTGRAKDPTESAGQGDAKSPAAKASTASPEAHDAIIQGNSVWVALNSQDVSGWFPGTGGSNKLLEELMSLTGTHITCVPGQDKGCQEDQKTDPTAQVSPKSYDKPPVLTFQDLVDGSLDGRTLQVLRCESSGGSGGSSTPLSAQCLNPSATPDTSFVGMRQTLTKILLVGDCAEDIPGQKCGLIGRYAANTQDVTSHDQQIMAVLGDDLNTILRLSRKNEWAARENAAILIPKLASDLAYNTVYSALSRAVAAAASYHGGDIATAKLMREAMDRITLQRSQYEAAHAVTQNQMEYIAYLNSLAAPSTPALPNAVTTP